MTWRVGKCISETPPGVPLRPLEIIGKEVTRCPDLSERPSTAVRPLRLRYHSLCEGIGCVHALAPT